MDEQVEYDMDEEDMIWLTDVNEKRAAESLAEIGQSEFELIMDRFEKESCFQSCGGSAAAGRSSLNTSRNSQNENASKLLEQFNFLNLVFFCLSEFLVITKRKIAKFGLDRFLKKIINNYRVLNDGFKCYFPLHIIQITLNKENT